MGLERVLFTDLRGWVGQATQRPEWNHVYLPADLGTEDVPLTTNTIVPADLGRVGIATVEDDDFETPLIQVTGMTASARVLITQRAGNDIIGAMAVPEPGGFKIKLAASPGQGNSVEYVYWVARLYF